MSNQPNQPNYDFYLKLDKWTKKDAALLLSEPSRKAWSKLAVSAVVEDILQYVSDHELTSCGLGKSNLHKKYLKV